MSRTAAASTLQIAQPKQEFKIDLGSVSKHTKHSVSSEIRRGKLILTVTLTTGFKTPATTARKLGGNGSVANPPKPKSLESSSPNPKQKIAPIKRKVSGADGASVVACETCGNLTLTIDLTPGGECFSCAQLPL